LYADGNPVNRVDENGQSARSNMIMLAITIASLMLPVVIDAFFNPMVASLLGVWTTTVLMTSIIFTPLVMAMGAEGHAAGPAVLQGMTILGFGFIAGAAAADWTASQTYGLDLAEITKGALRNGTLQGQIIQFWTSYGLLLLATIVLLSAEVDYATGELP
jgi:hypothetical protein